MKAAALAVTLLASLLLIPALAAADSAAPAIAITSPAPGLTIATDSVQVAASYAAPEECTITQLELLVDAVACEVRTLDPPQASGATAFTWSASRYADGYHTLGVRATDSEGRAETATIRILLRRSQMDLRSGVRISAPVSGATVSGVTTVGLAVADVSAVKYVIFLVDDVFKAMSNIAPFTYLWDSTRYLNGLHHLQVKVYLSTGAEWLSPVVEVRVDNPSGATTMQQPRAAAPSAPAPEPAQLPARVGQPVLPPPMHSESASPSLPAIQIAEAAVATPGTAPFVSPAGDLVIPPPPVAAQAPAPAVPGTVAAGPEGDAAAPSGAAEAAPPAPPTPVSAGATPLPELAASPAEASPGEAHQAEAAPTVIAALPGLAPEPAAPAAPTPEPAAGPVDAEPAPATTVLPPVVSQAVSAAAPAAAPSEATAQPRTAEAAPIAVALLPRPAQAIPAAPAAPSAVAAGAESVSGQGSAAGMQVAMLPPRAPERAPAPKVTAAPAPQGMEYVVQPGDCLWSIATAHNVSPARLAQVNSISDADVIHPGQRLVIPAADIYCDGRALVTEVRPFVADGRAIVPLRAVVEGAGGTVSWEPAQRQAGASLGRHQVTVRIGSAVARVDESTASMGSPAVLSANRTLVPLRFLGAAFDLVLQYQGGVIHIARAR